MRTLQQRRAGFSLVEVTLALGVAGFCLLAVFALLPMGVQTNQAAFSQTAATTILSDVLADMRVAAQATANLTTSPMYGIPIPGSGNSDNTPHILFFDGQGFSNAIQSTSRYRLTVTFPPSTSIPPACNNTNGSSNIPATCADIKISWPAAVAVDPTSSTTNPAGSVETVAAFSRP
jgi:uncharacterized protein (TIGR02598 family)